MGRRVRVKPDGGRLPAVLAEAVVDVYGTETRQRSPPTRRWPSWQDLTT